MAYAWPIILVVVCNTVYQVCAKSVPQAMNPLASLTATYAVAALTSAALYYLLGKEPNLAREYARLNWAPFALGIVIVGLEVGFIYAYKAGWAVSTASVVQSAFLAVALIVVGLLVYHEAITWSKIVGIVIVLIGLVFINK